MPEYRLEPGNEDKVPSGLIRGDQLRSGTDIIPCVNRIEVVVPDRNRHYQNHRQKQYPSPSPSRGKTEGGNRDKNRKSAHQVSYVEDLDVPHRGKAGGSYRKEKDREKKREGPLFHALDKPKKRRGTEYYRYGYQRKPVPFDELKPRGDAAEGPEAGPERESDRKGVENIRVRPSVKCKVAP